MMGYSRIGYAVKWNALDVIVRHLLNFVILVLLARMLSPEDFGLMAMLAVFVTVSGLLVDSGFGYALIQHQDASHSDESTIFFFTIFSGLIIALILCVVAPLVAKFYDQPILEKMTYWMALNVFLKAFGVIHTTLLTKNLDFKIIALSSVLATLVSGATSVIMAISGMGVWSLVGQALISTIVTTILLWTLNSWRPLWVFKFNALKRYFKFGGYLLWTGILATLHQHLYALLVGKLHTIEDVGYFAQASRIQKLPLGVMENILKRIAFPVFSKAAKDVVILSRGVKKSLSVVMFVNTPFMIWLAVLSEPIIVEALGEKWRAASAVLQVLALVGMLWPLHALNINALLAQGKSDLNAKIQLFRLSTAILILIFSSPFGIVAIAYGQLLTSIVVFFVNAYYSNIYLKYGALEQLLDFFPYLFASFVMAICVYTAMNLFGDKILVGIAVSSIVGMICYLIVCLLVRPQVINDIRLLIARK